MYVPSSDLQALLRRFGYESFRPGQERVIRSLIAGRDVLAVMPTGAGKSLVFQLVSQLLPGVTLVVSPLIALMKDQVDSVEQHGVEVGAINSAQPASAAAEAMARAQHGEARLLYVTPERLQNPEFLTELDEAPGALLVVDKPPCFSEWGYAFRPSSLALPAVADRFARPPILALTATATPWSRRDIE